jgi:hypothetical protein
MNQKNIEKMIPVAVDILEQDELKLLKNDKAKNGIESKYFGYLASFGPSVNQAGIVKTAAVYSKGDAGNDKEKIADLIKKVLINAGFYNGAEYGSLNLYKLYIKITNNNTANVRSTRQRILECATACKLSMNMFTKIKSEEE